MPIQTVITWQQPLPSLWRMPCMVLDLPGGFWTCPVWQVKASQEHVVFDCSLPACIGLVAMFTGTGLMKSRGHDSFVIALFKGPETAAAAFALRL